MAKLDLLGLRGHQLDQKDQLGLLCQMGRIDRLAQPGQMGLLDRLDQSGLMAHQLDQTDWLGQSDQLSHRTHCLG